MTRGAACLRRSGRPEIPDACVTQAREDVAVVIEAAVDGGGVDGHDGVGLVDGGDARRGRTPAGDAQLLAEIRQQIADLPSYGYRRACALVNRQRSAQGSPRVNPKRAYRVMA
jgi:hypothetical protein